VWCIKPTEAEVEQEEGAATSATSREGGNRNQNAEFLRSIFQLLRRGMIQPSKHFEGIIDKNYLYSEEGEEGEEEKKQIQSEANEKEQKNESEKTINEYLVLCILNPNAFNLIYTLSTINMKFYYYFNQQDESLVNIFPSYDNKYIIYIMMVVMDDDDDDDHNSLCFYIHCLYV
jgi:hypothetical protein